MDQRWQMELFGWLRATRGDQVVARFRTHKAAALLAYLAYHVDRSHPRDVLIELLWPESEPRAARTGLRTELTSLRHQLEPPGVPPGAVLLTDRATVRVNPAACVTDVARFQAALTAAERASQPEERIRQLTTAAELYRGALLPGFHEAWVLPERQWLAEAHLQALHELVGLLEARNHLPGAVQWARRAVAVDPLGEESHHQLIRLLLESGQVEAARAQFEQGEQMLQRELGSGLSPEVRALIREAVPVKDRPPVVPPGGKRGPGRGQSQPSAPPERPLAGPVPRPVAEEGAMGAASSSPTGAALRSSDNLPLRFNRFFGREAEIDRLREMLVSGVAPGRSVPSDTPRLVTLTGPGGTGKSRLALQVAQRLRGAFPGGAWFVSLLDLSDPGLIPDQIRLSLRLSSTPQSDPLEQVVQFLSRAPSLLLLDNVEHLLDRGAPIVQHLLAQVERLTVLVTSRRRLGLEGEREFPVAPLPVPRLTAHGLRRTVHGSDRDQPDREPCGYPRSGWMSCEPIDRELEAMLRCSSVALFVDRAQSARPDFQVTAHNAAAVAGLCRRLEGLPLAIELAAARSGVMTPQQMLSHLESIHPLRGYPLSGAGAPQRGAGPGPGRFELLVGRQRPADPRHRSLLSTLDWSYRLLSPSLQRFFPRLSVFRGGWTVTAAATVCEEPGALEYLEQLRGCSMVEARETAGEMRFYLLETLREYGAEQLAASGEAEAARRRHGQFFLEYAEGEPADLRLRRQRLEREQENLRAALEWGTTAGEDLFVVRLVLRIQRLLDAQGRGEERRQWLETALARAKTLELGPPVLARLIYWLGDTLVWQQRADEMISPAEELLARIGEDAESVEAALMREIAATGHRWRGDREKWLEHTRRNARFLHRLPYSEELAVPYCSILTMYSQEEDNVEAATRWAGVFEEKARQHHDLSALGSVLNFRGAMLQFRGDLRGANALLQHALEPFGRIGAIRHKYFCYMRLRENHLLLGNLQAAEAYANEQCAAAEAMADPREIAIALVALGKGFICQGRWDQAADSFARAAEVGRDHRRVQAWVLYASGRASLAQGKRAEARIQFQAALRLAPPDPLLLVDLLGGLEEADDPGPFLAFCHRYRAEHPELSAPPFVQWYLEPAEPDCRWRGHPPCGRMDCGWPTSDNQIHHASPPIRNPSTRMAGARAIDNSKWVWHDPFGDCSFTVSNGLEIRAANGRDLSYPNRSAPRLLRSVSGDFAIQTVCRPVSQAGPAIGGLLLWRNQEQHLRLDWGVRGPDQVTLGGCLPGKDLPDQVRWVKKDVIIGRGRLYAPRVILRLERRGASVRGLCSADGQHWFLVGQTEFATDDPLEVGVHAIGMFDRMLYPGAYPEGTAIRFETFELWT